LANKYGEYVVAMPKGSTVQYSKDSNDIKNEKASGNYVVQFVSANESVVRNSLVGAVAGATTLPVFTPFDKRVQGPVYNPNPAGNVNVPTFGPPFIGPKPYQANGATNEQTPPSNKFLLNNWLFAYTEPSATDGRIVSIPTNDPSNFSNWYAFEGRAGVTALMNRPGLTVIPEEDGAVIAPSGRYWVAVGPKVLDPNYPDSGKIWADEFVLGTELDIVIRNKETKEISYIYAVAGDLRSHTYGEGGEGVVHNGVPYPNSSNATTEGVAEADYSSVEFIRTRETTNLNQYEIVEIIVYDR
jgi:hypothetical protein